MVKNAREELREWMKRTNRGYPATSAALGISQPHLSHLLIGTRSPSLALAGRISDLTGIPAGAWVRRDDIEGVPV